MSRSRHALWWALAIIAAAALVGIYLAAWQALREAQAHQLLTHGLWGTLLRNATTQLPSALGQTLPIGLVLMLVVGIIFWARSASPRSSVAARWLIGVAVLHLALCLGLFFARGLFDAKGADRPNVIFLVVDTLRADHLGFDGYERETSPNIDRLAAQSLRFDNAYSHAPWTSPSLAALFTARYPAVFGYANSDLPPNLENDALLLPEILSNYGYQTHAIVSHLFVASRLGFAQGFDSFDEDNAQGPNHISAPSVTNKAIELLNRRSEKPFFLFLHYFDPHVTYTLQQPYDFYPEYDGKLPDAVRYLALGRKARGATPEDIEHVRALYDSEIRFTDEHIGRLLEHLQAQGLYDDTLIVLTADHGEAILDRKDRWIGHGKTLFQELIRVPLLIKLPGQTSGERISSSLGLIDVLPSLLPLLDIPLPTNHSFDGQSLAFGDPAARRNLPDQSVFSETLVRQRWVQSVVRGNWKLIFYRHRKRMVLHDLANDPRELENVSRRQPEIREDLIRELRAWHKEMEGLRPSNKVPEVHFTDEERQRLRALGYVP